MSLIPLEKITSLQKIVNSIPYILLGILAVYVFSLYGEDLKKNTLLQRYSQENKQFRAKADSAIKKSNELNEQVKKLQADAEVANENAKKSQERAQISEKRTNNLKTHVDSLAKILKTSKDSANVLLPLKDQIIEQQDVTIKEQKVEIQNLSLVIVKKDTSIALLRQSNDALMKTLTNIPVVDKCSDKIVFCKINKPSRKTSFIAGFVSATALTLGAVMAFK